MPTDSEGRLVLASADGQPLAALVGDRVQADCPVSEAGTNPVRERCALRT